MTKVNSKVESNSQQLEKYIDKFVSYQWPKLIQKLKAIHNMMGIAQRNGMLSMTKVNSKVESNSQLKNLSADLQAGYQWPKLIQKLKAIHNNDGAEVTGDNVINDQS